MTLIATIVTPTFCMQVSDRRMTGPAGQHWDAENKAVCVKTLDGMFSIACTGSAYLGTSNNLKRTDRWIASVLGDIPIDTFTTTSALSNLTQRLNDLFAILPPNSADTEVTFAISGFIDDHGFLAFISNRHTPHGPKQFPSLPFILHHEVTEVRGDEHKLLYSILGAEWSNDPRALRFMRLIVKHGWIQFDSHDTADRLVRRLVQFIQHGQRHNHTIGRNCLAVICVNASPAKFKCTAHASNGSSSLFLPQVVTPLIELQDWQPVQLGDVVSCEGQLRLRTSKHSGFQLCAWGNDASGPFIRLAETVDVASAPAPKLLTPSQPKSKPLIRRYKKRPRRK